MKPIAASLELLMYLWDTNVFSQILRGNTPLISWLAGLGPACLNTTVYIELIQGSIGNNEKRRIKKALQSFPVYHWTPAVAVRAIALIDSYSNSQGLLLADAEIAAIALEEGLTVVTYNDKDFRFIANLPCLRPPIPQI